MAKEWTRGEYDQVMGLINSPDLDPALRDKAIVRADAWAAANLTSLPDEDITSYPEPAAPEPEPGPVYDAGAAGFPVVESERFKASFPEPDAPSGAVGLPYQVATGAPIPGEERLPSVIDVEDADQIDWEDPRVGRSASGKLSLYAEPEYTPTYRGMPESQYAFSKYAYEHYDPTVTQVAAYIAAYAEEAQTDADRDFLRERILDLGNNGEESQVYKEFADAQWMEVRDAFERNESPAKRMAFGEDPFFTETISSSLGAAVAGFTDLATFGVGAPIQAAGEENLDRGGRAAIAELEEMGAIMPKGDRTADFMAQHPKSAMAGAIGGALTPFGRAAPGVRLAIATARPGAAAARGVGAVAGKLLPGAEKLFSRTSLGRFMSRTATQAAGGATAGAGFGLATEAARGALGEEPMLPTPSVGEQALAGAAFGGGASALHDVGLGGWTAARTKYPEIAQAEIGMRTLLGRGGEAPSPYDISFPFAQERATSMALTPIKAPPEVAAIEAAGIRGRLSPLRGQRATESPGEISSRIGAEHVAINAVRKEKAVLRRIGIDNEAFYKTAAAQKEIRLKNTAEGLLSLARSRAGALMSAQAPASEALSKFVDIAAAPPHLIGKAVSAKNGVRISRDELETIGFGRKAAEALAKYEKLSGRPSSGARDVDLAGGDPAGIEYVMVIRPQNARQLDAAMHQVRSQIREGDFKGDPTDVDKKVWAFMRRDLASGFPEHSKTRAKHARMLDIIDDAKVELGVSPGDRFDSTSAKQMKRIQGRVRRYGSGVSGDEKIVDLVNVPGREALATHQILMARKKAIGSEQIAGGSAGEQARGRWRRLFLATEPIAQRTAQATKILGPGGAGALGALSSQMRMAKNAKAPFESAEDAQKRTRGLIREILLSLGLSDTYIAGMTAE